MNKLTDKDKLTINNYIQHFVYKCIQCIVQSRRGLKSSTQSKATVADWFNLTIKDLPEIQCEAKSLFGTETRFGLQEPVCVEVSLKTNENETLCLEYWWLTNCAESKPEIRSTTSVYMFCEMLLKALITSSRVTPAYQLARRQAQDSYSICCSLKLGEPSLSISDEFKKHTIGTIPSLTGTIKLFVAYKTLIHLSPKQLGQSVSVDIRDNYYTTIPESSHSPNDKKEYSLSRERGEGGMESSGTEAKQRPCKPAFAPFDTLDDIPAIDEELPFASLLPLDVEAEPRHTPDPSPVEDISNTGGKDEGDGLGGGVTKEFVMLELRAPFAGKEEDIGRFYRECQTAPTLSMFESKIGGSPAGDTIDSLSEQLAQFEANAEEFTRFVNSLQEDDN